MLKNTRPIILIMLRLQQHDKNHISWYYLYQVLYTPSIEAFVGITPLVLIIQLIISDII